MELRFLPRRTIFFTLVLLLAGFPIESVAACSWGNCEDGIGRFEYLNGNYNIAQYKDGQREGYGVWRNADGTSECEGTNKLGKRQGLWICRSLLETRDSFVTSFNYYADGKNTHLSDLSLYLDDSGKVMRYVSSTDSPYKDYERIESDYLDLRNTVLGQLRLNLSSEFRQITLPSRERLVAYGGRKSPKEIGAGSVKRESPREQPEERKAQKPGCEFGDCEDGFGSYRFNNGDQYIGYFQDSSQEGYGIFVEQLKSNEKRECESFFSNGYKAGLRVCLRSGTSVATAYYYSDAGKANGRGISWSSKSGAIARLGLWRDNKFMREEAADLRAIASDWQAIKDSPQAVMRASFLTSEFLALTLPSADEQSDWLRKKELARTKETQVIPQEAPVQLGCLSGNCESGFGELATSRFTYSGMFEGGRVSGYTLITSSEKQCEARMSGGFNAGLEHCVDIETGDHVFAYKWRSSFSGAKITVSQSGGLVDYQLYDDDGEVRASFSSEIERQRLAALEIEYLLDDLEDLKKTSPKESQALRVASLNVLPVIKFGQAESLSAVKRPTPESRPEPKVDLKPEPKVEPKPREVSKAKVEPKSKPKPKPKLESRPEAELEPASKPTIQPRAPKLESAKPRSDLQRLAYIVAELNANRRQINSNYRLDRVRIDSRAFELVYEFFAIKPIRSLNTSMIGVANKVAYCASSKLKPFRDENMPARWSYVDSEDQTFEVLTGVSDCT